ncbi:MAG: N-6 DNA methylase, partial [Cetobacterium sp.]
SGVFKPYAGVSTGILIYTKTGDGGTDNVWFYDMTADGYSLDDKRNAIDDNDIPDVIERFKNLEKETERKRTDKSFFVPLSEIQENDYNLSLNRYKEVEYEEIEYRKPSEILSEIKKLEKKIMEGIEVLESMLEV